MFMKTSKKGSVKKSASSKNTKFRPNNLFDKQRAILFVAAFAVVGVLVLLRSQAATLRLADFETGDFSQIQSGNPTLQAVNINPSASAVVIANDKAYDGSKSARASIPEGVGNKYARTIWELTSPWSEGTDIWYGQAIYLPVGFKNAMQSYFVPMRWDNYGSSSNDSRGGISMWNDKRFRLFRLHAGIDSTETPLVGPFDISEGVWHWLEVRQKFSQSDGAAINEVYLDDVLIGSSTARNYFGVPITRLRNGIVAMGDQTNALDLWLDRLSIGTTKLGQLSAPDTTAPKVTISSPINGSSVGRNTNIVSTATDNIGVTKMEVYIDNNLKSTSSSGSISYAWNTRKISRGAHTITTKAYDAVGNIGTSTVTVYK